MKKIEPKHLAFVQIGIPVSAVKNDAFNWLKPSATKLKPAIQWGRTAGKLKD
ncbi:hypothetical protein FC96_GL002517 [Secundilactobacillus kimchicus JCM 15530]|uniref:Uncharacterized protein n=1 Tax=Secundilactobacillus kimchicus JCM 15530 TaxID=1302272 RepID=A0A0R1HLL0_9LACO|nr:hypothetical protein FC96_GL002517 [Secundilactobacillus kimchicus JCM 15530]